MKPKFENVAGEDIEQKFEALSAPEKFDIILKLFGTAKARDGFIELCKQYAALRNTNAADALGENYQPRYKRAVSNPQRAALHNRIMETLKGLSLQKLDRLSEKVLFEMASRETAGKIIKEWELANEDEEDEEDEAVRKRGDMSDTAYFHSLGKEH